MLLLPLLLPLMLSLLLLLLLLCRCADINNLVPNLMQVSKVSCIRTTSRETN